MIGIRTRYSDNEVVVGLQSRSKKLEDWFYNSSKRYFNEHFNDIFFDKDRKQEIFQTAFLKLWTEIYNSKITVIDGTICRQQKTGQYKPMTCQLNTFLMTFAKNEYRELVRSNHLEPVEEIFNVANSAEYVVSPFDNQQEDEAQKNRIIDDCIMNMSPRCVEILTLFYYQNKTLDEILDIRKEKNSSKNGLKTAKNKCMNTLRNMVSTEFLKFNIKL